MSRSFKNDSVNGDEGHWTRMKDGDHEALEILYRMFASSLYNYGSKFSGDKDLVKDCIQDLFVNIWLKRENLGHPADVKNYLFKAFRLNLLKKTNALNQFGQLNEMCYDFHIVVSPEDNIIDKESELYLNQEINIKLAQLTRKQQEIIFLKYFEAKSYQEIADIMDITVKGAYKSMGRAIESLRTLFSDEKIVIFYLLIFYFFKMG